MAYDKNLDAELFHEEHSFAGTKLIVSIYQYNQGEKKLQITRQNANADGDLSFTKLGRLRKEEIETILPSLQKAIAAM